MIGRESKEQGGRAREGREPPKASEKKHHWFREQFVGAVPGDDPFVRNFPGRLRVRK